MKPYKGLEWVRPADGLKLEVCFKDGWTTIVDLEPWIDGVAMLQPLRDPAVFAEVRVLDHGHTLEWVPDEIDIGGDQLWRYAGYQTGELMRTEDFRAWRRKHGLSLTAAAEVLGLSRRQIAYYDSGARAVPKTVMLACRGFEAMLESAVA